jgi:hypothetical protein
MIEKLSTNKISGCLSTTVIISQKPNWNISWRLIKNQPNIEGWH